MPNALLYLLALAASSFGFCRNREGQWLSTQGFVFGYALFAGLVTAAWFLNLSGQAGATVFVIVVAAFCGLRVLRRATKQVAKPWNLPVWVAIVFSVAMVAWVYYPTITTQGTRSFAPEIYDFPKQISAVAAAAHANRYPIPNPWMPTEGFAYNTAFYAPLGAIAAATGRPAAIVAMAGVAAPVAAFALLAVLVGVFQKLAIRPGLHVFGVLMSAVVGGYASAMVRPGPSIGFRLAKEGLLGKMPWFEDPFTYMVYVPQHLFALALLLAAFLEADDEGVDWVSAVRSALMLGIACHTSAAIVPIALWGGLVIYYLLLRGLWEKSIRQRLATTAVWIVVFIAIVLPVLSYFAKWSENGSTISVHNFARLQDWSYQVLSVGPVLILGIVGICWALPSFQTWAPYLALLAPAFALTQFVYEPELSMKAAMFLRYLLAPLALFAVERIVYFESRVNWAGAVFIFALVAHSSYYSLELMTYFIQQSYRPAPESVTGLVKKLQALPWNSEIGFAQPDQVLAGFSGHLTYMNFYQFRKGRYLSPDVVARTATLDKELEAYQSGRCSSARGLLRTRATYLLLPERNASLLKPGTVLAKGPDLVLGLVADLKCTVLPYTPLTKRFDAANGRWTTWTSDANVSKFNLAKLAVSAASPVDAAFVSRLILPAGAYKVRAIISGKLSAPQDDAGHVSLHGIRKLIAIHAGSYDHQMLETDLVLPSGFDGNVSAGLGGWCKGAGQMQVHSLEFVSFDLNEQ